MIAFHCEVWAGPPASPYTWLLRREAAATPRLVLRRLRGAACWLADGLDDDPDDSRTCPSAPLRIWLADEFAHEEITDRIALGEYVAAISVSGADTTVYTLAAMPAAGCVCLPPGPGPEGPYAGAASAPLAVAGGWSV
ncbi:hypothetical protein [Streptomyces sp. NPDC048623]|uniref:hypothetical protein n=1 Tax=Streptomyces sp. NPDC048623 TaxID=3155761 RepID=UPI003427711C